MWDNPLPHTHLPQLDISHHRTFCRKNQPRVNSSKMPAERHCLWATVTLRKRIRKYRWFLLNYSCGA